MPRDLDLFNPYLDNMTDITDGVLDKMAQKGEQNNPLFNRYINNLNSLLEYREIVSKKEALTAQEKQKMISSLNKLDRQLMKTKHYWELKVKKNHNVFIINNARDLYHHDKKWADNILQKILPKFTTKELENLQKKDLGIEAGYFILKELSNRKSNYVYSKLEKEKIFGDESYEGYIKQLIYGEGNIEEIHLSILNDKAYRNLQIIEKMDFNLTKLLNIKDLGIETKFILARNLFFHGKEVNKTNLRKEYDNYLKYKNFYKDLEIFSGREVIYLAHNEYNIIPGNDKFGKKATLRAIREQRDRVNFIRPENNPKDLHKVKTYVLKEIKNTNKPLTFVFNGHGNTEGLYLSERNYKGSKMHVHEEQTELIEILVKDLAKTLIDRHKGKKLDSDIIILSGCFNHNYIRSLYSDLNAYNAINEDKIPLPIGIVESEYNQLRHINFLSKYGGKFYENVLDLKNTKTTRIDTIINNEKKCDSNPSVFVPDDKNIQMQIL